MKGFLVRQLDADGYGMVNAMMEALGDLGGNRLRVYEQAKEVVSEGCPSDGLVDCPYSCASIARPLCETLISITYGCEQLDDDMLAYELARSEPRAERRDRPPYFAG